MGSAPAQRSLLLEPVLKCPHALVEGIVERRRREALIEPVRTVVVAQPLGETRIAEPVVVKALPNLSSKRGCANVAGESGAVRRPQLGQHPHQPSRWRAAQRARPGMDVGVRGSLVVVMA